ncbi:hypothetical protein DPMN_054249 [Dreissena polymorpha]|uniref:Uncharacterized protein n=1 Tax=Dreissena polymorpha TaxID=45954 RepID=A0A9D4CMT9_DREPO|nr:hypothetical protein DPMN_054249 [Dreissena polymorpha]
MNGEKLEEGTSFKFLRVTIFVPYLFHRRGLMVCALCVCESVCESVTLFGILR